MNEDCQAELAAEVESVDGEHRKHVAFLAHSFCVRLSERFNLIVAKDLHQCDGGIGIYLCQSERAAHEAACRHLAKLFALT